MESCTILIPHINTKHLLYGSVEQIKKRTNNVDWELIIVDQSDNVTFNEIQARYADDPRIKVFYLPKIDAGFPIDYACRIATKEFFCSLDVDAFPISDNWLTVPIALIKEFGFSFVGSSTGLHHSYPDVGNFFHINNYFRVSKTDLTKEVSVNAGFCRYQNRERTGLYYEPINWPVGHSDNGVVAQWYSDKMNMGPKLSIALNKIIGMTTEFGVYGMCLDDLVFHFVFGYHPDTIADARKSLGENYLNLERKIYETGLTNETVDELMSMLIPCHPYTSRMIYKDGKTEYVEENSDLFKRIDELKSI